MKALKLKSSTKENPIWGETYMDCNVYHEIMETEEPTIFEDYFDMKMIEDASYHFAKKSIDKWELVNVKIIIE